MIRRLLVWSLALLLITSAEARERTPPEQAKKITRGSRIVVRLKDGEFLRGRLGEVGQDRFTLEPLVAGYGPDRELRFQNIQNIQKITSSKLPSSVKQALLLPMVVVAIPLFFLYCAVLNHNCLGQIP